MFTLKEKSKSKRENKSIVIELSEEQYTALKEATGPDYGTQSEALRQMLLHGREKKPLRQVSFWVTAEEYAQIHSKYRADGFITSFKRYAYEVVAECINDLRKDEGCTQKSRESG